MVRFIIIIITNDHSPWSSFLLIIIIIRKSNWPEMQVCPMHLWVWHCDNIKSTRKRKKSSLEVYEYTIQQGQWGSLWMLQSKLSHEVNIVLFWQSSYQGLVMLVMWVSPPYGKPSLLMFDEVFWCRLHTQPSLWCGSNTFILAASTRPKSYTVMVKLHSCVLNYSMVVEWKI